MKQGVGRSQSGLIVIVGLNADFLGGGGRCGGRVVARENPGGRRRNSGEALEEMRVKDDVETGGQFSVDEGGQSGVERPAVAEGRDRRYRCQSRPGLC